MGEKLGILKDITETPRLRRQINAGGMVVQRAPIRDNAPGPGPQQAGNEIDQRRFAGAGPAEKRGDAAAALERSVDRPDRAWGDN